MSICWRLNTVSNVTRLSQTYIRIKLDYQISEGDSRELRLRGKHKEYNMGTLTSQSKSAFKDLGTVFTL